MTYTFPRKQYGKIFVEKEEDIPDATEETITETSEFEGSAVSVSSSEDGPDYEAGREILEKLDIE